MKSAMAAKHTTMIAFPLVSILHRDEWYCIFEEQFGIKKKYLGITKYLYISVKIMGKKE